MINIFNDEAFMKKYYPLLTVILLGLPLCSQALTLNLRGGYRSASHAYETLIQVSQVWNNGFLLYKSDAADD